MFKIEYVLRVSQTFWNIYKVRVKSSLRKMLSKLLTLSAYTIK